MSGREMEAGKRVARRVWTASEEGDGEALEIDSCKGVERVKLREMQWCSWPASIRNSYNGYV